MNTCPYCSAAIISNNQTCPNCGANIQGFQLQTGTTLGKYQIGHVLGQGGFGITYLANDIVLQREVAIKELFPSGSTRKNSSLIPPNNLGIDGFLEAKSRFLEEARTLAQFNHPGIVRVLEVFEANNTAYLVMEALIGETLGAEITREKKLSEPDVQKLALELCDALEVVHGVGLLHRDIKPDNIFLTQDARVVLVDFGSARSFKASQRTQHTQLVTPGYAAPEQYASEAQFGPYTDIYGVAATLYHALLSKPPPNATDRLLGTATLEFPTWVGIQTKTALTEGLSIAIQSRPKNASDFAILFSHTTATKIDTQSNTKEQIETRYQSWDIKIRNHHFITTKKTYDLYDYNDAEVKVKQVTELNPQNIRNPFISGCALPFSAVFIGLFVVAIWSQLGLSAPLIFNTVLIAIFYFYYYFPIFYGSKSIEENYEIILYKNLNKTKPESVYTSNNRKKIGDIFLLITELTQGFHETRLKPATHLNTP